MKTSISNTNEYPTKRVGNGFGSAKRSCDIAFRVTSNLQNVQCCNRLGCSTRYNSMESSINNSNRSKSSKSSIGSTSSKKKIGTSSKPQSMVADLRKPSWKQPSCGGTRPPKTSSMQIEMQVAVPTTSKGFSVDASKEMKNSETRKQIHRRQDFSLHPSMKSAAPKNVTPPSKSSTLVQGDNGSRFGLRNSGQGTTSNTLSLGCSSHMSRSKRSDLVAKNSDAGCSSDRGKTSSGSSKRAPSIGQRSSGSRPILSLSERPPVQEVPRRTISQHSSRSNISSSRTKRINNGRGNARISERANSSIAPETTLASPQSRQSAHGGNSNGRPSRRNHNAHNRISTRSENGSIRSLRSPSGDQDRLEGLNMNGVAEVLLALDRIEQDEELTHEQLLVLEAHLLLGGLNISDQHRDMRLDIDNMTYEELLALEEEMGSVSTGLTDKELLNCLEWSCYDPASSGSESKSCEHDVKCSICQEEYGEGDEVGKLSCKHQYHVVCIDQWLRLKNWCPICKASAASC
ncbi:hypothetical protein Syun_010864 [Stephania yunnanensis]|uniref:RING-type E3 ubiquitin transferase n=1 Tax=Stephania yunnanensis TaxID=152371 RepID=A0AAP0JX69_9MAGN